MGVPHLPKGGSLIIKGDTYEILGVSLLIPIVKVDNSHPRWGLQTVARNEIINILREIIYSLSPSLKCDDLESTLNNHKRFNLKIGQAPIKSVNVKNDLYFTVFDSQIDDLFYIDFSINTKKQSLTVKHLKYFLDFCSKIASKYSLHYPCEIYIKLKPMKAINTTKTGDLTHFIDSLSKVLAEYIFTNRATFTGFKKEVLREYSPSDFREISCKVSQRTKGSQKLIKECHCCSYWDIRSFVLQLIVYFVVLKKFETGYVVGESHETFLNLGGRIFRSKLAELSNNISVISTGLDQVSDSLSRSEQLSNSIEVLRGHQLDLGKMLSLLAVLEGSINKNEHHMAVVDFPLTENYSLLRKQHSLLRDEFSNVQKRIIMLRETAAELMAQISARLGSGLELSQRKVQRAVEIFTLVLSSLIFGSVLGSLYMWYIVEPSITNLFGAFLAIFIPATVMFFAIYLATFRKKPK